jgi:hypothetical protein
MEQGLEDVVEVIPTIENWGSHFPDTETVARHVTWPGVIGAALHMENRPPQLVTLCLFTFVHHGLHHPVVILQPAVLSYICRGCLSIHRLKKK